jgi:hypothetical protein
MKRTALLFVAILVFALMPAVASGQTDEEAAAIAALEAALGGIECVTVEGCIEEVAEVKAAVAALKALFPDVDYGALDGAIADLEAAIAGGDLDEVATAAAAVAAAGADVVAAANAAAGEGGEGGEGGDGTEEPTTVDTGSAATNSPSTALLFAAGILLMLSLGAFAIRRRATQR